MILMLKLVLFAILRNVLMIFITNIENANSVHLKEFQNDTIKLKMTNCENLEINMLVLKTWILD